MSLAAALLLCAAGAARAAGIEQRPPARATAPPGPPVSDQQIGQSIQLGANWLVAQLQGTRLAQVPEVAAQLERPGKDRIVNEPPPIGVEFTGARKGADALAVYALLQASQAISDERLNPRGQFIGSLLDELRKEDPTGPADVYARAIRATALAVLNRPADRETLKADAAFLMRNHVRGAYTYGNLRDQQVQRSGPDGPVLFDNSNSQYGLLGVWSAAEVGVEVPAAYWTMVDKHWTTYQMKNGQWRYTEPGLMAPGFGLEPSLSMTVAGVASLLVTHDWVDAPRFGAQVGRDPYPAALAKGLAWLEDGDNLVRPLNVTRTPDPKNPNVIRLSIPDWAGYTHYGIERVGLASGYKFFGTHDWYPELAAGLVSRQLADGSWGEFSESCYALLFLARGRHPVVLGKLRYDANIDNSPGSWANRPRDAANLARYASRELERPLNWQVLPLHREWTDWLDAPILELSGHRIPKLRESDYPNLKSYVDSGGLLLLHADGANPGFVKFATQLGSKLYPNYEWADLPASHELYTTPYKLTTPLPKLRAISNGSRVLVVLSPTDLTQHWQLRAERTQQAAFHLGLNLFLYAAGKNDLRNRMASNYVPPVPDSFKSSASLDLVRLKYAGNWDPEPYAFGRFAAWMTWQTGYKIQVGVVPLSQLKSADGPIAHLTGTAAYTLNADELAALKAYVEGGGTVIIDALNGAASFGISVDEALRKAFPASKLEPVADEDPMFKASADGMVDLGKPALRLGARTRYGVAGARLRRFKAGKGQVIYSPMDLTTGLLGTHASFVAGYEPAYAMGLMKNIVLGSWDAAAAAK